MKESPEVVAVTATGESLRGQIEFAALGFSHGAAVTKAGRLLTWGSNKFGQLGLGEEDDSGSDGTNRPRVIRSLETRNVHVTTVA